LVVVILLDPADTDGISKVRSKPIANTGNDAWHVEEKDMFDIKRACGTGWAVEKSPSYEHYMTVVHSADPAISTTALILMAFTFLITRIG